MLVVEYALAKQFRAVVNVPNLRLDSLGVLAFNLGTTFFQPPLCTGDGLTCSDEPNLDF